MDKIDEKLTWGEYYGNRENHSFRANCLLRMADNRLPVTRARGMGPLPMFLEREGAARLERVFGRVGLPVDLVRHRDLLIPLNSMIGLFEETARELGDDLLGVEIGKSMFVGD